MNWYSDGSAMALLESASEQRQRPLGPASALFFARSFASVGTTDDQLCPGETGDHAADPGNRAEEPVGPGRFEALDELAQLENEAGVALGQRRRAMGSQTGWKEANCKCSLCSPCAKS